MMRSGEEKFLSLEVCTHDADGDDMTHKYIVEEFFNGEWRSLSRRVHDVHFKIVSQTRGRERERESGK